MKKSIQANEGKYLATEGTKLFTRNTETSVLLLCALCGFKCQLELEEGPPESEPKFNK